MSEVVMIRPKVLESLAVQFVDVYEKHGRRVAGAFLVGKIEPGEYERMAALVEAEFRNRGYIFEGKA